MFLDFTVVSMALNFGRPFFFVQVLYATGLSMIAMAALVWIGPRLVLVVGGAIVLLAPVAILPLLHAPGALALLRTFTVLPGPLPGGMGIVLYPFVPWLGVMCLGFGYGHVFRLPASVRARTSKMSSEIPSATKESNRAIFQKRRRGYAVENFGVRLENCNSQI